MTHTKVLDLLQQTLPQSSSSDSAPHAHTMLDLLNLIVPLLDTPTVQALFKSFLKADSNVIQNPDSTVQKKSYRVLATAIQTNKVVGKPGGATIGEVLERFEATSTTVLPGAKPVRLGVALYIWVYADWVAVV